MKNQVFYIENFSVIFEGEDFSLPDVPQMERRKLSVLDKYAIYTMSSVYREDAEEIIYASRYGELERLDKIIDQYKEFGESSPKAFSSSVHNYPVGFFSQMKKINIPYYALSAGENSLSSGLLKAICSEKAKIIFTYADSKIGSASCFISKVEGKEKVVFEKWCTKDYTQDEFNDFVDFLSGKTTEYKTVYGTFKKEF